MPVVFKTTKARKPFAAPWPEVKEDWIKTNLDPGRKEIYELKDLAFKWGVKYKTLARISALEKWYDQLAERRREIAEASIERVVEAEIFHESTVRFRQASISKEAYELAVKRLRMLKPHMIDNKTMVALLKLGLDGERLALGLPQTYQFVPGAVQPQDEQYKPVAEHINQQQKFKQLGQSLLKFVETMK